MSPKYRAVRSPKYPEYWHVERRSVFGWALVESCPTKQAAQRMLDLLDNPEIIYASSSDNQEGGQK